MEYRNPNELKPHPINADIYGDVQREKSKEMDDLVDSIKTEGIKTNIQITPGNTILAGHRRVEAAKRVGMDSVPVLVINLADEDEQVIHIVHSNVGHRALDGLQTAYSIRALDKAYDSRYEKRGNQGNTRETLPEVTTSVSRETEVVINNNKDKRPSRQLASEVGVSRTTAYRAVSVLDAAERLEENGRVLEAQELKRDLKRSTRRAYDNANKRGLLKTQDNEPENTEGLIRAATRVQTYVTLKGWNELTPSERHEFFEVENTDKQFNKQEQANIEWANWSWNPVTGCKHPCPYCYARDIANRFYPTKFEPTLWPERLYAPDNMKVPLQAEHDIGYKNVFTCSMADLFGRWVPTEWIEAVLQVVADNPQWNFLFLTKFPIRMAEFDYPDNAWMGTSVDCQIRVKPVEAAFSKVRAKVKWLSCEPMIERLTFTSLDMFSWVVIGGASKASQTPAWVPPREWVHHLEMQAYEAGCMVYEKTNLQPVERLIEFPGQPAQVTRQAPDALRYLPEVEVIK